MGAIGEKLAAPTEQGRAGARKSDSFDVRGSGSVPTQHFSKLVSVRDYYNHSNSTEKVKSPSNPILHR